MTHSFFLGLFTVAATGAISPNQMPPANGRCQRSLDNKSAEQDIEVINVREYGAVPNDAEDDRAAIQAAIDAVPQPKGAIVCFAPGDYLVSDCLWLTNNCTLEGYGRATVRSTRTVLHQVVGLVNFVGQWTAAPTRSPLIAAYPMAGMIPVATNRAGATNLTTTTPGALAGVAPGDWLMVGEGAAWQTAGLTTRWNDTIMYKQVHSVVGDTVNLTTALELPFMAHLLQLGAYTNRTPYTNAILRFTPISNAWVQGLTFVLTNSALPYYFQASLACDSGIRHCRFCSTVEGHHAYANNTFQFSLTDSYFDQGGFSGFDRGAYGVDARNYYANCNGAVQEVGESASFVTIRDNTYLNHRGNNPLIGGANCYYVQVCNNTFVGNTNSFPYVVAFKNYARDVLIDGNTFLDVQTAVAIGDIGVPTYARVKNIRFSNNTIRQAANASNTVMYLPSGQDVENVTLENNLFLVVTNGAPMGPGTHEPANYIMHGNLERVDSDGLFDSSEDLR